MRRVFSGFLPRVGVVPRLVVFLLLVAAGARAADMAGSAACAQCHKAEAQAWAGSHHARAMQVATPATVLGDFSGVSLRFGALSAQFRQAGGRFIARLEGADGKLADFTVTETFGVAPLQQYLVSFQDGRKQALPWAWDSREKAAGGQRWFYLHPEGAVAAGDALHWTGYLQTWNFMCAECHVTGLAKNYDAAANMYRTTQAELGVGCESCHGPGAAHIGWARAGAKPGDASHGFAARIAARPPVVWAPDPRTGSPVASVARPSGDEEALCAVCHSRRAALREGFLPGEDLAQRHRADVLAAGLFSDDGQMLDEVFNHQSFEQSLMYARGVTCGDCHDPHSGALKLAGAAVCSQCHAPAKFATIAHTGHVAGARAPDCISCHMPARRYMVIDRRHDHSFRIPRPDLSVALGTPNACTDCHADKSASWAAAAVDRWHPGPRHGLQSWAAAIHAARQDDPAAVDGLRDLAADAGVPAIARATVLTELTRFLDDADWADAASASLRDGSAEVRIAALQGLAGRDLAQRWRLGAPLLADSVAGVRMEAGLLLADQPEAGLAADDRQRLRAAWAAYVAAQRLAADRPEGRAALADFWRRRGDVAAAEAEYRGALVLWPQASAVAVNLADLYRAQDNETQAEAVLRAAVRAAPAAALAHHALGLSLIRQKKYADAVVELDRAVALAPDDAQFAYVDAVALQSTGAAARARAVAHAAAARHPHDARLQSLLQN